MIQEISITETGTIIRVDGNFDMSANTDLKLTFTSPTGDIEFTENGAAVVLGTVDVFDKHLNEILEADTYVEYTIPNPSLFQELGYPWQVLLTYVKDNVSPVINSVAKTVGKFNVCEASR